MSDQEQKLKEAEYFYSLMVDSFEKELYDPFTYNMSAFLSAARSILQYTHDRAVKNNRGGDYNKLIAQKPILKYFKGKRNVNIHEEPVKPIQQVFLDLHSTLTVRMKETVGIQVIGADGEILRDELSEPAEISNDSEVQVKAHLKKITPSTGITSTLQYRFEDWTGDEDILEMSEQYLKNLREFIQGAILEGLIPIN
ncbi:hypothetical protein PPYC1_11590 [Paenibacillus polymyxa]|uniref:hypothetical protein n=1 Tax=Paenibacillus polymyxa TaxID=1406 RepID=UPI0008FC5975|nr:hypothetical protein [Paenibacillus polymyxa]APB70965.1 hypothetical protein PPYC1_11590 [Paenibacillus polymyxa]